MSFVFFGIRHVLTENCGLRAYHFPSPETVYGRVRRLLLKDTQEVDGKLHVKRMTHQAIATRVGSSREMVSKIISDLTQDGYITVGKDTICIERNLPSGW